MKRFKIHSVETVSEVSQNSNVKIVTDEKKLILRWLLKLTPFSCTYHLTFSIKLPQIELNCLKFWKKEISKSHKAQKVKGGKSRKKSKSSQAKIVPKKTHIFLYDNCLSPRANKIHLPVIAPLALRSKNSICEAKFLKVEKKFQKQFLHHFSATLVILPTMIKAD